MADFRKACDKIFNIEGKYSFDVTDKGGETYLGIAEKDHGRNVEYAKKFWAYVDAAKEDAKKMVLQSVGSKVLESKEKAEIEKELVGPFSLKEKSEYQKLFIKKINENLSKNKDKAADKAREIYKSLFWDTLNLDKVKDQVTAEMMFDCAVNLWWIASGRYMRSILEIKVNSDVVTDEEIGFLNEYVEKKGDFASKFVFIWANKYSLIIKNDQEKNDNRSLKYRLGWFKRAFKYLDYDVKESGAKEIYDSLVQLNKKTEISLVEKYYSYIYSKRDKKNAVNDYKNQLSLSVIFPVPFYEQISLEGTFKKLQQTVKTTDQENLPKSPSPRMKERAAQDNLLRSNIQKSLVTVCNNITEGAGSLSERLAGTAADIGNALLKSIGNYLIGEGMGETAQGGAAAAEGDSGESNKGFASGFTLDAAGAAINILADALIPTVAAAQGGLFMNPTTALVGEGGQREAVIPLDRILSGNEVNIEVGTWASYYHDMSAETSGSRQSDEMAFAKLRARALRRTGRN